MSGAKTSDGGKTGGGHGHPSGWWVKTPDGIVEGTDGADRIDLAYDGDPEGDRIDAGDAILPGAAADDDLVVAGAGNDTVAAGAGDDLVFGGTGDDRIDGGPGKDTLIGGAGADTVRGGAGDDLIIGGDAADGDGPATVTITFEDEEAAFRNTVGAYRVDPETGAITGVVIGFPNASLPGSGGTLAPGSSFTVDLESGGQLGLFIIADGASLNDFAALGDGTLSFETADGSPATVDSAAPILVHTSPEGARTVLEGAIYHSAGFGDAVALNPDGIAHVLPVGQDGAGAFTVAFEDLPGGGDRDFDDSVLGVTMAPGTTLLAPGVDGPAGDADAGDLLEGGAGDDTILGGAGADTIVGGDGSDSVTGGDGDDVIDTSGPVDLHAGVGLPDRGFPPLPDDPDPENDRDFVDGGAGADTIRTGDDRDTILGGDGDDVIDAGIDDDLVDAGAGNDRVIGGEGGDTILGGAGDDTLYGGLDPKFPDALNIPDATDPRPDNGRDLIEGGDGNDLIFGQDDRDTLLGGAGDDTIDGGIDDDLIEGGAGADLITGGQWADTLLGGDDADRFVVASAADGAGDLIDGGTGGDDRDVLDLTGAGPFVIVNEVLDPDGDSTSGTVNFLDGDGGVIGALSFREIETIVPCFTPGTLIATPRGEIAVEDLRVGDPVITRDNGLQEIRWIGARTLDHSQLGATPHLNPILIRSGALGHGLPERDMMVSPNHRVLVANERTALYFEEHEVLVAAKHLINHRTVTALRSAGTTYIHFMFDAHEVVLSNGAWTESFQPGDYTLGGLGNAQRTEILDLFPDLHTPAGRARYGSVRKTLKRFEAALLR